MESAAIFTKNWSELNPFPSIALCSSSTNWNCTYYDTYPFYFDWFEVYVAFPYVYVAKSITWRWSACILQTCIRIGCLTFLIPMINDSDYFWTPDGVMHKSAVWICRVCQAHAEFWRYLDWCSFLFSLLRKGLLSGVLNHEHFQHVHHFITFKFTYFSYFSYFSYLSLFTFFTSAAALKTNTEAWHDSCSKRLEARFLKQPITS